MSEVAEAPASRTKSAQRPTPGSPWPSRLLDVSLVVAFLALAFLLGLFPLKDTDFWWHLRTGDLIRQTGTVPTVDTYTFGAEGRHWTDLHWTFQVLLSWGYQVGGVPLLTLAKCVITCAGLFLLITARKRDWPFEVMLLAWLPALIVLGGRMYVRPETISFFYMSIYMAVLFRLDDRPWLAFVLPVVQILWVNVQGLFVLGPILLTFALIDAAVRPGAFCPERRRWWRLVLTASGLVGLACIVNPYGLVGALYPLQLAATMKNDVFSATIGELQSIPAFIKKTGYDNVPLQIHIATILVGLLSFLVPMIWRIVVSLSKTKIVEEVVVAPKKKGKGTTKRARRVTPPPARPSLLPSLFRLLMFLAFTYLSWQATRNSHQFAAVVGTVTAWNLGEWAAAIRRRSEAANQEAPRSRGIFKVATLCCLVGVMTLVGSGKLYAWMGEGRTIGIGEEPLWFPHEAVKAAGRPGMPDRSICFHNGHSALYEYAYAPDRKTYTDARLEVMGAEIYKQYIDLERRIRTNTPGWQDEVRGMENPLILADNTQALNAGLNATLLTARDWRCVWFDPVAALYVHESYPSDPGSPTVDFGARHFSRFAASESKDPAFHIALAKAYWNTVYQLLPQPSSGNRAGWREAMLPLITLGLDHARLVQQIDPDALEGWKYAGLLQFFRDLPTERPLPRFRYPFDPVQDLSSVRAIHDLVEARKRAPKDGNVLATLIGLYQQSGMNDETLRAIDDFIEKPSPTVEGRGSQAKAEQQRALVVQGLGTPPPMTWKNLNELTESLNTLLMQGRAEAAAKLLETAYPVESRPWVVADRIATLRLHLGQADEARRLWLSATDAPKPAVRLARAGMAALVLGDFEMARKDLLDAVAADPSLFEAQYGLALTEFDAGNAKAALDAATRALAIAPDDASRLATTSLADQARPYAK